LLRGPAEYWAEQLSSGLLDQTGQIVEPNPRVERRKAVTLSEHSAVDLSKNVGIHIKNVDRKMVNAASTRA
jgi:hypothetical protein